MVGKRPGRGRSFRWFALAVALLAVLVAVGMLGLAATGIVSQVEEVMNVARPWLRAGQLTCVAILWLRWQQFVRWLEKHNHISPWATEPLIRARHRVVALVLLIVLTAGMGLPFSLFDAAGSR
jgi:hypothetical protein